MRMIAFALLVLAPVAHAQGYGVSHEGKPKYVEVQSHNYDTFTVASLQQECEATDRVNAARATNDHSHLKDTDYQVSSACIGYIQGSLDQLVGSNVVVGDEVFEVTVAEPFTFGQAEKLFMKYVVAHPEQLSKPAYVAVTLALGEAGIIGKKSVGKLVR